MTVNLSHLLSVTVRITVTVAITLSHRYKHCQPSQLLPLLLLLLPSPASQLLFLFLLLPLPPSQFMLNLPLLAPPAPCVDIQCSPHCRSIGCCDFWPCFSVPPMLLPTKWTLNQPLFHLVSCIAFGNCNFTCTCICTPAQACASLYCACSVECAHELVRTQK